MALRRRGLAFGTQETRACSAELSEGAVDRDAYVLCVLEQLRRRDVFAALSARWVDPRAQLLDGAAWQAVRADILAGLGLAAPVQTHLAELAGPQASVRLVPTDEGRVKLAVGRPEAAGESESLKSLRATVAAMLPRVDLPELLLEITHLALASHRLPDTGEVVPLLQIVPSKSNEERLLLVTPELASVLAAVIHRIRDADGRVPPVARYDPHERTTGPPLPHLFQRKVGRRREIISTEVLYRLLNDTLHRAGLTAGQPLHDTPHDFRRMFATDAVTGGLPVRIAAKDPRPP
ncbi:hypothetical protein [Microbispora sp. NPDC046933]|uniref:hypothetical protein n=1 Tax=Microbispora sp. NPDC046933 TaxID=3155618 RepID=UPI0033F01878